MRKRPRGSEDAELPMLSATLLDMVPGDHPGERCTERYTVDMPLGCVRGHFLHQRGGQQRAIRPYTHQDGGIAGFVVTVRPPPPQQPPPLAAPSPSLPSQPPTPEESEQSRIMTELAAADRAFNTAICAGDVGAVAGLLDGDHGARLFEGLGRTAGVQGGLKMVELMMTRGIRMNKKAVLRIAQHPSNMVPRGLWTVADVSVIQGLSLD